MQSILWQDMLASHVHSALAHGVLVCCIQQGPTYLKCGSDPKFKFSVDFSKIDCTRSETCSAAENQQKGVWADPQTWRGNGVPSALDAVHISDSPVNVQEDAEAQGVIIEGSMVRQTHMHGFICAVYIKCMPSKLATHRQALSSLTVRWWLVRMNPLVASNFVTWRI